MLIKSLKIPALVSCIGRKGKSFAVIKSDREVKTIMRQSAIPVLIYDSNPTFSGKMATIMSDSWSPHALTRKPEHPAYEIVVFVTH